MLGHGLDRIYPPEHAALALELVQRGGLLTEFISRTKPDRHNFPTRNRIVAGMSDATIVIETGIKGGSIITAELANGYNRDVFAFPGKTTDPKSAGCNWLIQKNKAALITDSGQVVEAMGWDEKKSAPRDIQRNLFQELTNDEQKVVDIISKKESIAIDELNLQTNLSTSILASVLLSLELKGVVVSLPGKAYSLA